MTPFLATRLWTIKTEFYMSALIIKCDTNASFVLNFNFTSHDVSTISLKIIYWFKSCMSESMPEINFESQERSEVNFQRTTVHLYSKDDVIGNGGRLFSFRRRMNLWLWAAGAWWRLRRRWRGCWHLHWVANKHHVIHLDFKPPTTKVRSNTQQCRQNHVRVPADHTQYYLSRQFRYYSSLYSVLK